MEFLEGETFWDAALPELEKDQRMPVYEAMVEVLAELATLTTRLLASNNSAGPATTTSDS